MRLEGISAAVTGGASGLGLATARKMIKAGAQVTLIDLPGSAGAQVAQELGDAARFVAADVTDEQQFASALDAAGETGPLRALVHCAGRGAHIRLVEKDGQPGALKPFEEVIELNLIGSYNALRLGAARMARHEPVDDERGAIVLTASVAAAGAGRRSGCAASPPASWTPRCSAGCGPMCAPRWRLRCHIRGGSAARPNSARWPAASWKIRT